MRLKHDFPISPTTNVFLRVTPSWKPGQDVITVFRNLLVTNRLENNEFYACFSRLDTYYVQAESELSPTSRGLGKPHINLYLDPDFVLS